MDALTKKRIERARRLNTCNKFIKIVASHGRKFFKYNKRVGFFLFSRGHVYWNCEYTQKSSCVSGRHWKNRHGSTLRRLLKDLADYIRGNSEFPIYHVKRWPGQPTSSEQDIWGYSAFEMRQVRLKTEKLLEEEDN